MDYHFFKWLERSKIVTKSKIIHYDQVKQDVNPVKFKKSNF